MLRFLPPGGAVRAFEFYGDPGLVQPRPELAPGRAAVRVARVPRTSSTAPTTCCFCCCLVIPFRRLRAARGGRDGVHRRALDHADRVGVQPRARRAVVSAAHRDADRRVDRLPGLGREIVSPTNAGRRT